MFCVNVVKLLLDLSLNVCMLPHEVAFHATSQFDEEFEHLAEVISWNASHRIIKPGVVIKGLKQLAHLDEGIITRTNL